MAYILHYTVTRCHLYRVYAVLTWGCPFAVTTATLRRFQRFNKAAHHPAAEAADLLQATGLVVNKY